MTRAPYRLRQATAVFLVASGVLIGTSLAGVGASLALVGAVGFLAAALFAVRDRLASAVPAPARSLGPLLAVTWLGPVVAGLLVLIAPDATPGELQTLGGLCGLVAMANYFLRPVYGFAIRAGRRIGRTVG